MTATALLVVDMLNSYRHPDADRLAPNVAEIVDPLADLITRARQRDDVELVYVNDNYGDFVADRNALTRAALEGDRPDLVKPIVPTSECRFLTKVRHSAFYSTTLDYLLGRLNIDQLIITGQVTEQCILYTALDAYVRHYTVRIPRNAVAHIDSELGIAALNMMQRNMQAELTDTGECLP